MIPCSYTHVCVCVCVCVYLLLLTGWRWWWWWWWWNMMELIVLIVYLFMHFVYIYSFVQYEVRLKHIGFRYNYWWWGCMFFWWMHVAWILRYLSFDCNYYVAIWFFYGLSTFVKITAQYLHLLGILVKAEQN